MKNITKEQTIKFLAFIMGSDAEIITMDYLNSIKLSDNSSRSIEFFEENILDIFNKEIFSYGIKNGEKIGLLLSGGLDSSLLLVLLKKNFPNSDIYTYTLGYSKDDVHLSKAKEISEFYNTIHKEIIYDISSNLFEIFDEVYKSGYDLEGEDSLIMNHILAKEVKNECKIVFSGFGLDYIFAGMDLFRNSYLEELYNEKLVDKSYIYDILGGNKYYLKYILDKFSSDLGKDFFIKYGEYYGYVLNPDVEKEAKEYFYRDMKSIRGDISELKKQIYFIITSSLSNRYNPYNEPYKKQGIKHYNPFGSKEVITKVIGLNIPDQFLYNPFTNEKKFIIRKISKNLINKDILSNVHFGKVLKYHNSFKNNKVELLSLIEDNKDLLLNFYPEVFLSNFDKVIEDSIWHEKTLQIIIILQFIYYVKYNNLYLDNISIIHEYIEENIILKSPVLL